MVYDNLCKHLAEQYPAQFARWLLAVDAPEIQVLKTELSTEPIRADALTLLQANQQILHLEFQTSPEAELPFRMLDYWVRLYRQYRCDIEQVVLFLKPTTSERVFVEHFSTRTIQCHYRVLRLWEQDPAPLLLDPALLPLAPLARTDDPPMLLEQVAAQVAKIEPTSQRQSVSAAVQVLAGLRFDKDLIRVVFREDTMRESVIYQDILQQGLQQGVQQGKQEEGVALILRLLNRRLGSISSEQQQSIQQLSVAQLEDLAEALLDFSGSADLENWLHEHRMSNA